MSSRLATGLELRLGDHRQAVERRLAEWQESDFVGRLWRGDHRLWVDRPVAELTDRLGWLRLPETMPDVVQGLEELAAEVAAADVDEVLLFGMGGSSLAPEVFQRVLGNAAGRPPLTVLDTTHPEAIASVARGIDPARTVCVVSSKSGSTIETTSLFYFFWSLIEGNHPSPGSRFVAITDPGSVLESLARERSFRAVVPGPDDVGGRFSALSTFGLVPAALIGADVGALLASGGRMAAACRETDVATGTNPGAVLGALLGELALAGRDKLTLLTVDSLASFPDWIEQLVAESTGKDGVGIVPVVGEPLGDAESYAADRLFVALSLADEDSAELEGFLDAAESAGHPCAHLRLARPEELGGEMFRWEFATAAAGAVLGVHPFNQENVQLAKSLAKKAMAGERPEGAEAIREVDLDAGGLRGVLAEWSASAGDGDYVGLQAYLPPDPPVARRLRGLQGRLRARTARAVTAGFGPRFLHSTGQLHKGGANNGVFLQIVDRPETDLRVPETDFTFGQLIAGQADGDAAALLQTGRRLLRVRLGADPLDGLDRLGSALG